MRLLILFIFFSVWQSSNNQVFAWGTSVDGKLDISPIRNDCSTEKPIATYSFNEGQTVGILFATSCRYGSKLPNSLVDIVKYRFIDTGGSNSERCYGIVDNVIPLILETLSLLKKETVEIIIKIISDCNPCDVRYECLIYE